MTEIFFLGTAAAAPSRDRCMSCVAVRQESSVILFDCAEGSQRQIMVSPLSFMKISAIFVSHMHGDHILGIPGLLQTMGMSGRKDPLIVCGPKGFRDCFEKLMGACEGGLEFEVDLRELSSGDTVDLKFAKVTAFETFHGVTSVGFVYSENDLPGKFDKAKAVELGISPGPDFARLQNGETVNGVEPSQVIGPARKGTRIVYTGDTMPSESTVNAASGSDVLIHESTYCKEEAESAEKHHHSTCVQAAEVASKAGVGALILTHISNRYDTTDGMLAQSKEVFPDTFVANDMDVYRADRSGVTLISEDPRS